eukprot:1999095-Pyramimonas_sp.AAC.1
MLCGVPLCDAVPSAAMLTHVVFDYAVPRLAMPCYALIFIAMLCHDLFCAAVRCHYLRCNAL